MSRTLLVGEPGTVIHVSVGPCVAGKIDIESAAERMALIVIQEETLLGRRKIGQSTVDCSEALRILMRVGAMKLYAAEYAWRFYRRLGPANTHTINSEREKDIGITHGVVIEKVCGAGSKVVHVQSPSPDRNRHTELTLFVAFAVQWNKTEPLIENKLEKRPRDCRQWWSFVEPSVKSAQSPVEFRDRNRGAHSWTCSIFR